MSASCLMCKKEDMKSIITVYERKIDGQLYRVINTPAEICTKCGTIYYDNSVVQLIRKRIIDENNDVVEEIKVFDFTDIINQKDIASDDLYLLVMTDSRGGDECHCFDLFPTPRDTIMSLRNKLCSSLEYEYPGPAWKTSEIKLFKTTKSKFDDDFDNTFGNPKKERNILSWFDIHIDITHLNDIIEEELDLGRFILENTQTL